MPDTYISELRSAVGHRPLVVSCVVLVVPDSEGRVLLQRRSDGLWGIPGGVLEPGESFEAAAPRELLEETGPGSS